MIRLADFKVLSQASRPPSKYSYATLMAGFPKEHKETKGAGKRITVIDTGFFPHKDFKDGITEAPDVGMGIRDGNVHGTWCLGQIGARGEMVGCLPESELISIKAFDDKGNGSQKHIIKALEKAGELDTHVISMSFGGGKPSDPAYHRVIKELEAAGVILTAAAGNMGKMFPNEDTVLYPACFPEVAVTTAINIEQEFADFSSSGPDAEVAMAGVSVWGLGLDNGYIQPSGTSMANPTTAAIFAMLQAKSLIRHGVLLTPREARKMVQVMAHDLGIRGRDEKFGFGVFSFGNLRRLQFTVNKDTYLKNGREQKAHIAPFIKDNRMFMPIRDVGEGFDCLVDYDDATKTVTVKG